MFAALLPIAAPILLWLMTRSRGIESRAAAIIAAIIFGVLVTVITELLSAFHAIHFWSIFISWLIVDASLVIAIARRRQVVPFTPVAVRPDLFTIFIALIAIITFALGIFSAPSNWDSMTYHLPRVMHWIQNHSVDHYPTNNTRQLYLAPWAEFAILQFQILAGGDRFAFLPQWGSLIVILTGVSLITKQLGADQKGQTFAAIFAATMPMVVLQAPSTQNSLVVAAWLVCAVYFLFDFAKGKKSSATFMGASIGLATLTKGTAYVLAVPILIAFAIIIFRARPIRITLAITAAIVAMSLNAAHIARNMSWFGSPLMEKSEMAFYRTDSMSPALLTSNVLRNLSLHLSTPSRTVNLRIENAILFAHRAIGVESSDTRITFPGQTFSVLPSFNDEDLAGNPLHLIVIAIVIVWGIASCRRRAESRIIILFFAGTLLSFVLFCATIKWQYFNVRLHVPLFVLAAAPVGMMAATMKASWLRNAIAFFLIAMTLPALFRNPNHPLLGRRSICLTSRESQYFLRREDLFDSYKSAVDLLATRRCDKIGVAIGANDYEYPLWEMMRTRTGRWPTFFRAGGNSKDFDAIFITREYESPPDWERHRFGEVTVLIQPR